MKNNNHYNHTIEIEKSKDGNDILIIDKKSIHSKFNPTKEASNFIYPGKNLIIIFGLGLAYHVNNIIKNNPDSLFIIYEPYQQIFDLRSRYIDDTLIKKHSKRLCLLNELDDDEILQFLIKNQYAAEKKMLIYSNLGYKNLLPEIEIEYYDTIKNCIQIIVQNTMTESNFTPLWTKNFLLNISNLNKKPLIKPQKKEIKNNLAVIACAGPTLIEDIDIIKKEREHITLFAVDTAIKSLNAAAINPDFIISLDGQFYSIYDFTNNIPDDTALILDSIAYPPIARLGKNIFLTITENILNGSIIKHFLNFNNIEVDGIKTGGTVSDYALSFALSLGFQNIYFTGLDFSFPYLQTHAKGSPYYSSSLFNSNYFETQQTLFIQAISKRELKMGESKKEGQAILSDFILQNYAYYLNKFALKNNSINIYNSIHYGLKIPELKEAKLDTLIKNLNSKRLLWHEIINQEEKQAIEDKKIKNFYDTTLNALYQNALSIDSFLKSTNFDKNTAEEIINAKKLFDSIYNDFEFLKKFLIMTNIILEKKNITENNILWYKHTGHKLLQSIYYIIRILQKVLKQIA